MLPDITPVSGKYEILRKLNEGGMGAIYLVRHRLLDELRVIKVLRAQIRDEKDFRDRFVREARTAIQLRHPNIAQLYEFELDDQGTAYMVLEFIDGRTLEELINSRAITSLSLKVEIALQCLRALAFLHKKGFVHRDIAPDNIMLTRDPEGGPLAKLLDLGIVKVLRGEENLTGTSVFLGKFRYASPEQLESSQIDARSDLYSFGVLLYQLLTSVYPIPGSDMRSLMSAHLLKPPISFADSDPMDEIPDELRAVVLHALEKDPNHRIASAEEFAARLRAIKFPSEPGSREISLPVSLDRILGERGRLGARSGTTQANLDAKFDFSRKTPSYPAYYPDGQKPHEEMQSRLADGEARLARGDLNGAESAARILLQRPHLPQDILDGAEALLERVQDLKCGGLIASAETALNAGLTTQAVELLNQVLRIDPRNFGAKKLIEEISGRLERQALEERHSEAKSALRRELHGLLAEGRFADARRRLGATSNELLRAEDLQAFELEIRAAEAAQHERRRSGELEKIRAGVAAAIQEMRYAEARALLVPPPGAHWTPDDVQDMARQVEMAEASARARRYDQGIQQARALLGQDRLEEARREIARLRSIQPLGNLGEGIAQEIERRAEELRRQQELAAAAEAERLRKAALDKLAANVRELLGEKRFEPARVLLEAARKENVPEQDLAGLIEDLARTEAADLAARQQAILEQARGLLSAQRLEEARAAVSTAKSLAALGREGKRLETEIEAAVKRQREREEAERRREEVARRQEAEERKRQEEALERGREALAQAKSNLERGALAAVDSALAAARRSPDLAGEVLEVERRLAVLRAEREARHEKEVRHKAALREIERLLRAGDLAAAGSLIEAESPSFPDERETQDLAERIVAARAKREDAERRERELGKRLSAIAGRLEVAADGSVASELKEIARGIEAFPADSKLRAELRAAQRTLAERQTKPQPAAGLTREAQEQITAPLSVVLEDLAGAGSALPAAEPVPGAADTLAGGTRRRAWPLAAAALALVAVLVGTYLATRGKEPAVPASIASRPAVVEPVPPGVASPEPAQGLTPLDSAAPTSDTVARTVGAGSAEAGAGEAAATPASLVLNALPWAEVRQVVPASGARVPLPEDRSTPLVLSLEPGTYEIELAHPDFGVRRLKVSLSAGESRSETVELHPGNDLEFLTGRAGAGADPIRRE